MEISTREFKRVTILKANGRIDSASGPVLADAFRSITGAGRYRIVFDMSEVAFMSSIGLRVIIDVQRTCKRFNRGELALASPSIQIVRTLELAGFYTLFNVYATLVEAVGSV